jgi:hypothetical protein
MQVKFLLSAILITACTAPPHYSLRVHQSLLHGSDAAIMAGCQRGVLRWHRLASGEYPRLIDVGIFCEDVRRSFEDEIGEGNGTT